MTVGAGGNVDRDALLAWALDPSPVETREFSATDSRLATRAAFAALRQLAPNDPARLDLREYLVRLHLQLVENLARRFVNRGEPLDDLIQVGTIGLLKAIDRLVYERGVEFSTYATPTILGEIKRHFRDRGWSIRVPRRLQEMRLSLAATTAELTQELGGSPTMGEIAERLEVDEASVAEGFASANAYSTVSLDAADSREDTGASMLDALGEDDAELGNVEYRASLRPLLAALDPRDQRPRAPLLPWHDAIADRGRDRDVPDARVAAAVPYARTTASGAAPRLNPHRRRHVTFRPVCASSFEVCGIMQPPAASVPVCPYPTRWYGASPGCN